MAETITLDVRFNGPPGSGNGGYTCGRLAAFVPGPATVRLKAPPPLGTPLTVVRDGSRVRLVAGETEIAEARPASIDLAVPAPPTFEAAIEASRGYTGFERHWYPTCFVCGPNRGEGDGLRIFAGPVEGSGIVAAPFVPGPELAGPDGTVEEVYLWSALDCPGAFSFEIPDDRAILLGELTVAVEAAVRPGEKCVVIGWEVGAEGRKHFTGTALFHDGAGIAVGRATWIEVAA